METRFLVFMTDAFRTISGVWFGFAENKREIRNLIYIDWTEKISVYVE